MHTVLNCFVEVILWVPRGFIWFTSLYSGELLKQNSKTYHCLWSDPEGYGWIDLHPNTSKREPYACLIYCKACIQVLA